MSAPQTQPVAPLDIIPPEILELLGPPPLLPSEDANLYFATWPSSPARSAPVKT